MASAQPKQRVFTGIVTKIHDNFGFIDDDVFFQLACCEGKRPGVGDRVIVEAQFNPTMPFKWNASRVQYVGHQQQDQMAQFQAAAHFNAIQSAQQNMPQFPPQGLKFVPTVHGGGLLGPAPVNLMNQQHINQPRHQQMSGPKGNRGNPPRPAARDHKPSPQRRSRERDRVPKKRRTRSPPPRKRSLPSDNHRSVSTDKSDKTQRRPAPRYMVQYVKRSLKRQSSDVLNLKNDYMNLYIPSDFFAVKYNWQETITLQRPLSARKCHFHILSKDVETLDILENGILNPPDADHSWVAKVMLLQAPSIDDVYKQCCRLAEDESDHFLHQSRVYKFLVGSKGKKELMAIGGSWSPSLDGPDPGTNPGTIVNTAVRTCRALTGIDLSKCTNWRRVLQIQYHRDAEVRKGHAVPDRVETTVLFFPDIHSCMSTSIEYSVLRDKYLDKCEAIITAEQEDKTADNPASEQIEKEEMDPEPASNDNNVADEHPDQKESDMKTEEELKQDDGQSADDSMEVSETGKDEPAPTHHSKLDIKSLKVQLLRRELEARGLSPRGLKMVLVTRLTEAAAAEAQEEADKPEGVEIKEEDGRGAAVHVKVEMQPDQLQDVGDKDIVDVIQKDIKEGNPLDEHMDVIDEVKDEVKNTEESEKKETDDKKVEEKPKINVERLRRHYTLPESHPVIPVHPNSKYKKGNFECCLTPLSNLLGYRQEDNKESIFEVSLFAEAFSEMLQRNHAFNIYKAICNPLPKIKIEKKEEVKDAEEEKEETKEDEPQAKKSKSENEEESTKDKKSDKKEEGDSKRSHSHDSKDSKKRGSSSTDRDSKSKKDSSHKEAAEKMVTLRKDLLLSFVYFDRTQCGYIKASDMSDIINSIGIGLSRSQITKLLSTYIAHDNLKYRKLTDVPESQLDAYKELLDKAPEPDLDNLESGNKVLMSHGFTCNGNSDSSKPSISDGIIIYNGAVVDVKSLQDKLASCEDNEANLETTLSKLKSKLESTSQMLNETRSNKKSLDEKYESTKKELAEVQDGLKSATELKSKFEKTLKSIAKSVETALPKEEK